MAEKRKFERINPKEKILVKEDTGEIINYYHLRDISLGGMYLLKKISSTSESNSKFTFIVPKLMNKTINGEVYQTRLDDKGNYGTAIRFDEKNKDLKEVVESIKKL